MELKHRSASLALGSGAARGLAHIGVIRVLEQHGVQIAAVAGCSMGALIGGIYAAGKLQEYERWVRELTEFDVLRLLDLSFGSRAGLFKGEAIIDALRKLLGDYQIEDLSLPFTAVATDLKSRREVWLDQGKLFDAIRASIAIPAIFRPVKLHGRWLLDGGLVNPVPIAPTLTQPSDLTVAVSVTGPPVTEPLGPRHKAQRERHAQDYRKRIENFIDSIQVKLGLEDDPDPGDEVSMVDVMLGALDTMQQTITRFKLAAYEPDLLIEVPINVCQGHEFYRADEIIAAGEHWAEEAIAHWQETSKLRLR
jgi:NTE family protein